MLWRLCRLWACCTLRLVVAARTLPRDSETPLVKLPKWKDDDVAFVIHLLKTSYRDETITIADLVRALGYRDRRDDGNPTPEYYRIRVALHAAHARKLVKRSGLRWGLP